MKNKIIRNKKNIESRNLQSVIATTSFVVIFVPELRISSITIENMDTAIEHQKEYENIEQETNTNFYYEDSDESHNKDENNIKFCCNQNFSYAVMRTEVDNI